MSWAGSWWRWQTRLSAHALSVPKLSQNVGALVPWTALMGRCCCRKDEKTALLRVWPSLSLCHHHCTYTTTSSSSLPHPHRTQFLVCGLYLFGFAFFQVVFHAEISGSLVSWEVFWSTEGFVGLGLNIGRKCRYWGGHGIVSWKSAFRWFEFFYKYQLKLFAWKKNTPWNTVLMFSLPYLHIGNSQFDRTDFSLLMKNMEQIPFILQKLKDIFSPGPLTVPVFSFLSASVKFSLICSILWF